MRVLLYVIILLLLSSCKTLSVKQETSSETKSTLRDSTYIREIVTVDTVFVPSDSLSIDFPLGKDTTIEKKSGRLTSKVQKKGEDLTIYAQCESYEELVLSYEKEIFKLQQENNTSVFTEVVETVKKKGASWLRKTLSIIGLLAIVYIVIRLFLPKLIPF